MAKENDYDVAVLLAKIEEMRVANEAWAEAEAEHEETLAEAMRAVDLLSVSNTVLGLALADVLEEPRPTFH